MTRSSRSFMETVSEHWRSWIVPRSALSLQALPTQELNNLSPTMSLSRLLRLSTSATISYRAFGGSVMKYSTIWAGALSTSTTFQKARLECTLTSLRPLRDAWTWDSFLERPTFGSRELHIRLPPVLGRTLKA